MTAQRGYKRLSDALLISKTFCSTMKLIKSKKGGQKLSYEGYMHTKKTKTTIYWECANHATDHNISVLLSVKDHSHDPGAVHVVIAKLRHQIKDDFRIKKAKTIFLEATNEMHARAEKLDIIRHDIKRMRRGCRPSPRWRVDWNRPFLIHDSGADTNDESQYSPLKHLSVSFQEEANGTLGWYFCSVTQNLQERQCLKTRLVNDHRNVPSEHLWRTPCQPVFRSPILI